MPRVNCGQTLVTSLRDLAGYTRCRSHTCPPSADFVHARTRLTRFFCNHRIRHYSPLRGLLESRTRDTLKQQHHYRNSEACIHMRYFASPEHAQLLKAKGTDMRWFSACRLFLPNGLMHSQPRSSVQSFCSTDCLTSSQSSQTSEDVVPSAGTRSQIAQWAQHGVCLARQTPTSSRCPARNAPPRGWPLALGRTLRSWWQSRHDGCLRRSRCRAR